MPSNRNVDPTDERARATEAMKSTPISGKDHAFRADGDHRPRQDAAWVTGETTAGAGRAASQVEAAPEVGVEAGRHISRGIPGAGAATEDRTPPRGQQERKPGA